MINCSNNCCIFYYNAKCVILGRVMDVAVDITSVIIRSVIAPLQSLYSTRISLSLVVRHRLSLRTMR